MTDEPVKTGDNRSNSGQFTKGDPRINRKGRPKTFDAARRLAQQVGHRPINTDSGEPFLNADGEIMTRIESIFQQLSGSRSYKAQELFLAYAVGKPKDEYDLSGKIVTMTWKEFIESGSPSDPSPDSE